MRSVSPEFPEGVRVRSAEYSFGVAAAIITSTALIVGLDAATATRTAIVSGLIIVALADNLTDSISIHLYQEAERLETRRAFRATLLNFGARLLVALTFVSIVVAFPPRAAIIGAVTWGIGLLVALSAILARERGASVASEVGKHLTAAVAAVLLSRLIGVLIR
jgi:VIT1/CCC1 family predicted Fe2+/Mn2+ transporter